MSLDRRSLLLYAVTDRSWAGGRALSEMVEGAVEGGATMVQLREKDLSDEELCALAEEVMAVCRRRSVPFIVNDRVDIAVRLGADGAHIGQGDMDVRRARAMLGGCRVLGVSAQTVAQALAAERGGADYLGVGAVFPTATKADAEAVSPETLREICRAVTIPVVAIGGITRHNILKLKGAGVSGVAVVSALFAAPDVAAAARELRALAEEVVFQS